MFGFDHIFHFFCLLCVLYCVLLNVFGSARPLSCSGMVARNNSQNMCVDRWLWNFSAHYLATTRPSQRTFSLSWVGLLRPVWSCVCRCGWAVHRGKRYCPASLVWWLVRISFSFLLWSWWPWLCVMFFPNLVVGLLCQVLFSWSCCGSFLLDRLHLEIRLDQKLATTVFGLQLPTPWSLLLWPIYFGFIPNGCCSVDVQAAFMANKWRKIFWSTNQWSFLDGKTFGRVSHRIATKKSRHQIPSVVCCHGVLLLADCLGCC